MILAGDIGGTKTTLAVFESGVGSLEKIAEETFSSKAASSLDDLVSAFLARHNVKGLTRACFGVPGAVVDGVCRTTNLPWVIDERALARSLKVPRVRLLNDLQAAAYGMLFLDDSELVVLNPGRTVDRRKNLAVIAAGTGLGEALLVWDGERHIPMASEGGHCSFSPRNELEVELLRYLQKKHDGHVSWERVVCGPALGSLYEFLRDVRGETETPYVRDRMQREDMGAVIGLEATKGADRLCVAAARLMCSLYGAEAGNLALKGLATGGVFVGGGIAPKLLAVLKDSDFMASFVDKGRFRELLAGIPVVVATNDKAPLIGAGQYAARLL
jgi:glucokinase